jgi:hypothetical protein
VNPYRAGPWPGLTPSGAGVLLGCAFFLAVGQILIGPPRAPLPDLPAVGLTALLPLALAVRMTQMPGAASGVCAAYLLPRSVIGLFQSSIDQPPLLLVPAMAFDVTLWLLQSRLTAQLRALAAGAIFGVLLGVVEPPFRVLLGADSITWSGPAVLVAAVLTGVVCAATATVLNVRGTAT